MPSHPIYRVKVNDDPACNPSIVGEFDDLAEAIDYFTQVVEAHFADFGKGGTAVGLIAE